MSNSRNKTPIIGNTTSESEKKSKQLANRKFRKKIKQLVHLGSEDFPQFKLMNNIWSYSKDGKHYVKDLEEKYLRK
jgi:uncharacterized FlgJ-related protein